MIILIKLLITISNIIYVISTVKTINYSKYSENCKKNICLNCEKEHKNHRTIYYGDILPKDNLEDKNNELKKYINIFNNEIDNIINKLKSIKENIGAYFNISNNYIMDYNNYLQYKNYDKLKNIGEFIKFNNIIINDINTLNNKNNINEKFAFLMNIYNKINHYNYITSEIEINEKDINKDIRIINSFEQFKRDNQLKKNENNYEYENENKFLNERDIAENCEIKINNKIIPFSYLYKFNEKGKYIIKYTFKNNLSKLNHLFSQCTQLAI